MREWPIVCVILLTHAKSSDSPRVLYARRTLKAALANLRYSGPLRIHIADDSSYSGHIPDLWGAVKGDPRTSHWSSSHVEHLGYGGSYNHATQIVHQLADVVLPLEDDWELTSPLDIDPYVDALLSGPMGCIRMGYLGHTNPLRGEVVHVAGQDYLLFDPESPETHVWAGHPRLETVAWQRRVGPWPERIGAGETEFEVANRPEARVGVAWPIGLPTHLWAHIGTAQAREDQRDPVIS